MIDQRTVLVSMPCYDGRNMAELTGALVSCSCFFGAFSAPCEVSHPTLVRNLIAASFMASAFEWLVCIDNDVVPSREDFARLMEPCDTDTAYDDSGGAGEFSKNPPKPTRVEIAQCIPDRPLEEKISSEADALVCAEYAAKNDNLDPIKFGMGFVRIHRSVFETLQNLKHDGGPTVEVRRDLVDSLNMTADEIPDAGDTPEEITSRKTKWHCRREKVIAQLLGSIEDKAGTPRLSQWSFKGRVYYDYYPSGALISQFVPNADWKGEDHGFFTLCMLAGIIPRIETRTRLTHIGRKGYPYNGPNSGGGQ